MDILSFEKLVSEAVLDLPENIRKKINNTEILVEEFPTQEQARKVGVKKSGFLLGLYEGVPETAWGKGFGSNLPDKITIFQNSIEKFADSSEKIKDLVKIVVWHEIAHHFGFNEKRVRELEKKWNSKL